MVYVMDKISDMTEAQLNNCRNFIPHERLRRMDAYRNIADKKRCASAYMLLVTGMKHEYRKSPPEFVIGDVNKDGKVNLADLVLCHYAVLGNFTPEFSCDANGDGKTNALDIAIIRHILLCQ